MCNSGLTPLAPGVRVACATGFQPVISCNSLNMRDVGSPQRTLEFVEVPVIGAPPLRVWFDVPRWGDGSTGDLTERVLERWQLQR